MSDDRHKPTDPAGETVGRIVDEFVEDLGGATLSTGDSRRLVVCAHWSDDLDLDAIRAAMQPFRAAGTEGVVIAFAEDDPMAVLMLTAIKAVSAGFQRADAE